MSTLPQARLRTDGDSKQGSHASKILQRIAVAFILPSIQELFVHLFETIWSAPALCHSRDQPSCAWGGVPNIC